MPTFCIEYTDRHGEVQSHYAVAANRDAAVNDFWFEADGWSEHPQGVNQVTDVTRRTLQLVATTCGDHILLRFDKEIVSVWPSSEERVAAFEECMLDPHLVLEWDAQGISGWDTPHRVLHEVSYPPAEA